MTAISVWLRPAPRHVPRCRASIWAALACALPLFLGTACSTGAAEPTPEAAARTAAALAVDSGVLSHVLEYERQAGRVQDALGVAKALWLLRSALDVLGAESRLRALIREAASAVAARVLLDLLDEDQLLPRITAAFQALTGYGSALRDALDAARFKPTRATLDAHIDRAEEGQRVIAPAEALLAKLDGWGRRWSSGLKATRGKVLLCGAFAGSLKGLMCRAAAPAVERFSRAMESKATALSELAQQVHADRLALAAIARAARGQDLGGAERPSRPWVTAGVAVCVVALLGFGVAATRRQRHHGRH